MQKDRESNGSISGQGADRSRLADDGGEVHSALQRMPAMMHAIDAEGKLIDVSDLWLEKMGYRREEVLGRKAIDFMTPDASRTAGQLGLPEQFGTGSVREIPLQFAMKNGGVLEVLLSASSEYDDTGALQRSLAVFMDVTEHRKLLQEVRAGQERYRTLIREMVNGFALHEVICDAQGAPVDYRFMEINAAFEAMTGLAADQLVGRSVREVLPEIDPFWIETYGQVALSRQPAHFEKFSDELQRHFEVHAFSPCKMQFAVFISDITERKKLEAVAKRRLAGWQLVSRIAAKLMDVGPSCASPAVTAALGEFAQFLNVDRIYLNLMQQAQPVIRSSFQWCAEGLELFPFVDMSLEQYGWAFQTLRCRTAIRFEDLDQLPHDAKHERELWTRVGVKSILGIPLADEEGNGLAGFFGLNTERKKKAWRDDEVAIVEVLAAILFSIVRRGESEAQRLESQSKLQGLIDAAIDWVWETDAAGVYLYAGDSVRPILGYAPEEIVSKTPFDFMTPKEAERVGAIFREIAGEGRRITALVDTLLKKDGTPVVFETNAVPLFGEDGTLAGYFGTCRDITESTRTKETLRRSEAKLKLAQRIARIGNWSWEVEHDRVEWSDQVYEIFMAPRLPASFELARSFVHPADLDRWEREVATAVAGQRPFAIEYRAVRTDGAILWVRNETLTICDRKGLFIGYEGTVQDITAQKEAEANLALFKRIVESSQIAIAVSDPDGRLIYVNPAHTRLFGDTREHARQANYREFYPLESVDVLNRIVAPALARGEDWEGIIDAFDTTGRRFPLWERASTVRDSDGKIVCAFGFMQDVTERLRAERELKDREAFLSSLLEAIPIPVYFKDRNGLFLGVNKAFEVLTGKNRDQLIGKTVFDLNFGQIPELHQAKDKEAMELGEGLQYESRATNLNGAVRDCVFNMSAYRDGEGTVKGVLGTILDVTDLRRMERLAAEIAESERVKLRRELHDTVCQRLAGAGLLADHLREDIAESSVDGVRRVKEIALLIRQSLNEAHLIGQHLKHLPDVPDALLTSLEDLAVRITGMYNVCCRVTSRKRVELQDHAARNQLLFIAQEAVSNAVRHADATRIGISLSRRGQAVVLRIRDNGKGMPRKKDTGKGMGIKIMQERAELIGARLSIQQPEEGGTIVACVWKPRLNRRCR